MEKLSSQEQRYLEGYGAALQDILFQLTGSNGCSKSYDPMTCTPQTLHSYAFDMKDGGRHHPVLDYRNLEEIKKVLLDQVLQEIREDSLV